MSNPSEILRAVEDLKEAHAWHSGRFGVAQAKGDDRAASFHSRTVTAVKFAIRALEGRPSLEMAPKDLDHQSRAPAGAVQRPVIRRVVCAAIRAADGDLLLGIRHYSRDMHAQMHAREDGAKFAHRHDDDQGFVDQWGIFMGRVEAFDVAMRAGQDVNADYCGKALGGGFKLYSEGLY